jgi:hypothetical protein
MLAGGFPVTRQRNADFCALAEISGDIAQIPKYNITISLKLQALFSLFHGLGVCFAILPIPSEYM